PGSSQGTGQGATCSPTVPASPAGCPETAPADAAWNTVQTTCNVAEPDLDTSTLSLTAAAAPKLCATCACRQAVYEYYGKYRNCTSEDQGNTALAKNLYAVASACR